MTPEKVINCFKRAGITSEDKRGVIADSDDSFKDFQESLDALKASDPDMVPTGLSTENVINVDHGVITTGLYVTEDDILEQFQTCQVESDKDDNDSDGKTVNNVVPELPSRRAVESVLDAFKNAAPYGTTEDECRVFF